MTVSSARGATSARGGECVSGAPRLCGPNQTCDENGNQCSCDGCLIDGNCVAVGTLDPTNTCQICQPSQSQTSYSPNFGAPCGDGPSECSSQDTCNAQGECATNHSAPGTLCGFMQNAAQCDAADTCNGSGDCVLRVARDGDPCDDGLFCTQGDQCQGGQCVPGAARNCGANQTCVEAIDQCRCNGCLIAGSCLAPGTINPANPCQICDPIQNPVGFVGNTGASCGTTANQCSAQDTCNAQGQCQPNHSPLGTPCGSPALGQCDVADTCDGNGMCVARVAAENSPCEDGQFCSVGDRCQAGQCVAGGARDCGPSGTCDEAVNGCRLPNGSACETDAECSNSPCRDQFIDGDGDGYPNLNAAVIRVCGNTPQPGRIFGRVDGEIDCCDGDDRVFPGAAPPATGFQGVLGYDQRNACMNFNYDCRNGESSSGRQSRQYPGGGACINESIAGLSMGQASQVCDTIAGWDGAVPPACGQTGTMVACAAAGGDTCTNFGFIQETRFCF